MALATLTLQVLEGVERGRVFADLVPPVTIGREEENAIRLNDERVSRFHAKIQEDGGRLILTDLDSTNGTRVNGHPVQLHALRPGDRLTIGRTVMLYGSREEIASRAAHRVRGGAEENSAEQTLSELEAAPPGGRTPSRSYPPVLADEVLDLFPEGPPEIPRELRTFQRAQLADLLAYLHERMGVLLATSLLEPGRESDDPGEAPAVRIDWIAWQNLQALQMELAVYLRRIAEPDD